MTNPELGAFVQLRGRTWLVEGVAPGHDGLTPLRLACVADDAQGETLDVLWDAEIAASVHRDDAWEALAAKGTDDPEAFGAYLRAPTGSSHGVGLFVVTLSGDRICAVTRFDNGVLPWFGLPRSLPSR